MPYCNPGIAGRFLILLTLSVMASCVKEPGPDPDPVTEKEFSPEVTAMVSSIEQYYHPLSAAPLDWQDEDLLFMDDIAGSTVVAMGEASHGTADFFEAKFRVFRYLVEHHGYRVFAIEADMGECMIINEAIRGQKELEMVEVAAIMKETMLFWTWKTREVRDMLLWMNAFNQGRDKGDRIRYVGMDCQLNHYSADLLWQYLFDAGFPCMHLADTLLYRLEEEAIKDLNDYTGEYYTGKYYERDLLEEQELRDSMLYYRDRLTAASDELTFEIHFRMAEVLTQATELRQALYLGLNSNDMRDGFMAENVVWFSEYLGPNVFLWAHNLHVNRHDCYGRTTLGDFMNELIGDEYVNMGFQFAHGTFNAYGIVDGQLTYLHEHSIAVVENDTSMTWIMSQAEEDYFHVSVHDLLGEQSWVDAFERGLYYMNLAAVYDQILWHCYLEIFPDCWDHIIFLEETSRSSLL